MGQLQGQPGVLFDQQAPTRPRAFSPRMTSKILSTISGARPSDGSSSRSSFGATSAPGDGQHLLLAAGERAAHSAFVDAAGWGTGRMTCSMSWRMPALSLRSERPHLEIFEHGKPWERSCGPRATGPGRLDDLVGGQGGRIGWPRNTISPPRILLPPVMHISVVVLPAPLAPMTVTISPSST